MPGHNRLLRLGRHATALRAGAERPWRLDEGRHPPICPRGPTHSRTDVDLEISHRGRIESRIEPTIGYFLDPSACSGFEDEEANAPGGAKDAERILPPFTVDVERTAVQLPLGPCSDTVVEPIAHHHRSNAAIEIGHPGSRPKVTPGK